MKILFVCTGNTCRSPMAEHLFKKMLKDKSKTTVEVDSAGVSPATHLDFPNEALQALKEQGVETVNHKAKGLTKALVNVSDWILVMEDHHKDVVQRQFPDDKGKIYLLKEFAGMSGGSMGISDPYGQSAEVYRETLKEIKDSLDKIVNKI